MFRCKKVGLADGHGRLRDPPSRSSAWRENFLTPPDYNVSIAQLSGDRKYTKQK